MNTPNNKALEVRRTNQKFRRLFNSSKDIGGKLSSLHVNRAHWGSGYSKKDLPKDSDMQ